MKRIITLSLLALVATVILASCSKRDHYQQEDEWAYWYRQESGEVVYYSDYCEYFIVELNDTYAIMQSLNKPKDWPIDGDYMYGNFKTAGTARDYLNDANTDGRSDDYIMRAKIVEFQANKGKAIDIMNSYYCGVSSKAMAPRTRVTLRK